MFRILIALGGLAVAASYMLPWFDPSAIQLFGAAVGGGGEVLQPHPALTDLVMDETLRPELPWQVWAFLATFALAGLVGLLALFGVAPGPLAVLAGLGPFAVVGYLYFQGQDAASGAVGGGLLSGLSLDIPVSEIWQMIQPAIGYGLYAYFGGAVILLLSGLFKRG